MRLLRASLLKLVRRPATRRTPVVIAVLLGLIYLSIGASAGADPDPSAGVDPMLVFPDAYLTLASMLMIFLGIAGAAYAGTVAASEWSWSTMRAALARGESRFWYVTGLFAAIALLTLVAWLALYALGIGAIVVAATIGGVAPGNPLSPANPVAVALEIGAGGWGVLMLVGIGFAVSFISRSAVAGVAMVVGVLFIEQFAGMSSIPTEVLRFAPMTAASTLVGAAGDAVLDAAFVVPLVVTTVYLAVAIGAAGAVSRRAQVL